MVFGSSCFCTFLCLDKVVFCRLNVGFDITATDLLLSRYWKALLFMVGIGFVLWRYCQ